MSKLTIHVSGEERLEVSCAVDHLLETFKLSSIGTSWANHEDKSETVVAHLKSKDLSLFARVSQSLDGDSAGRLDYDSSEINNYRQLQVGDPVEKYTGEARWEGVIVARYLTTKGKLRFVVEVMPQGFQMIAVGAQLRHNEK